MCNRKINNYIKTSYINYFILKYNFIIYYKVTLYQIPNKLTLI